MTGYILVAAAVEGEIFPIVKRLRKPVTKIVGGRKLVIGEWGRKRVGVLETGPGIVNTAQALCAAVEADRPALILQTGCAGAFKGSGLVIGDIGIAETETDVHLGIGPDDGGGPAEDPPFFLVGDKKKAWKATYPLDMKYSGLAFDTLSGHPDFRIGKGPFLTVSTITATDSRAKSLEERYGAVMESMEGSAAAHIALHYGLPALEIRSVSNFAGKRDIEKWNLPLAFARAGEAVSAFLDEFQYGRNP